MEINNGVNHEPIFIFASKYEDSDTKRGIELVKDGSDYLWLTIFEEFAENKPRQVAVYNLNKEELQRLRRVLNDELKFWEGETSGADKCIEK